MTLLVGSPIHVRPVAFEGLDAIGAAFLGGFFLDPVFLAAAVCGRLEFSNVTRTVKLPGHSAPSKIGMRIVCLLSTPAFQSILAIFVQRGHGTADGLEVPLINIAAPFRVDPDMAPITLPQRPRERKSP